MCAIPEAACPHLAAELSALLVPAPDEILTAIPVGNRVNSAAHDDPACIEPLVRQTGGFSEQLFE